MLVARMISGEKVKAQGLRIHSKFLPCPHFSSVPIWPIYFYLAKIKSISWQCVAIHFQVKRLRSDRSFEKKVSLIFCLVRPMTPSLFGWITSYVAYIQNMRWRGVAHHFHDQRSKVVQFFLPCPLCSSVPISLSPFIWDTYTTHEATMCCAPFPDQKNKGQGHMSHLNFVMSVVSCLFDRITSYIAYIQHMRGRCVVHHFQDERSTVKVIWIFRIFYRVLSVAPSLFHRFSSYDIHTTHEVTMCRAQFPGRNVLGQGHTDGLKCSFHGFLLIWPNHVICVIHTTYAMCRAPFSGWKVKGQGHTGHFKCYFIDMYHRGSP